MTLERFAILVAAVFAVVIAAFLWVLLFNTFTKLKTKGIFIRLGIAIIIIAYIVAVIIRFIDSDFDGIGNLLSVLIGLILIYIGLVKQLKGDGDEK